MPITIYPCDNLIQKQCTVDDLKEYFRHMESEWLEVKEAWKDFINNPDDGKAREHLAEEIFDLMTNGGTIEKAMESMDGSPEYFAQAVGEKVRNKNYARGYHNKAVAGITL